MLDPGLVVSVCVDSYVYIESENGGVDRVEGSSGKYLGQIPKNPRQIVKVRFRIIPAISTFVEQLEKLRDSQF